MRKILTLPLSLAFLSLACNQAAAFSTPANSEQSPIAIAIHGGAGTIAKENFTEQQEQAYRQKLEEAVNTGYKVLAEGGSSTDAVIVAIQILEASPYFNAGVGAVYTYDGTHELDASIMDGATLEAGAVSGVKNVASPIALANVIKDRSAHVMLSGEGAQDFAKEQGLELVDNSFFDTPHRKLQLDKAIEKLHQSDEKQNDKAAYQNLDTHFKYGTVGAVALDKEGNLAAGTSTGGMTAKRFGRIGDSPIIGAGTYANNQSCAVSATGHGEFFIRYHVAADICARVQYQNISLQQAADTVVNDVLVEAGGSGGVIAIDSQGNIAMPFNSKGMYRASKKLGGNAEVAIFKSE
ncbi:isoaspartyl peptidase/L-asparaginase family protein [Thalassotalea sp. PS06]|uniref:isoaspartyl peptidase/L-asparaginase family protein n=1 Tax=Thalassotalea sp. PS06 TaxID=2594005 RepID=UPI001165984C|nr:isoaspartyl peptidase/L-asparaginase [Thalassotalea sp. PS06]QDP01392.1 isoaspartyl peptidase/L-asparaginase [Thalassotalea sp. PS06]